MSKNTLQRILVVLTLIGSLALLVFIALDVFKVFEIANDIHLTMRVGGGHRKELTRLDAPVQRLVWLIATWIVIQFAFFIGLLVHFFKSTKKTVASDYQEESSKGSRRKKRSYSDDSDAVIEEEQESKEVSVEATSEELSSTDTTSEPAIEEDDEILEVPKPVGRRSRRDRRK